MPRGPGCRHDVSGEVVSSGELVATPWVPTTPPAPLIETRTSPKLVEASTTLLDMKPDLVEPGPNFLDPTPIPGQLCCVRTPSWPSRASRAHMFGRAPSPRLPESSPLVVEQSPRSWST